jgi:hypothetical protein
MSRKMERNQVIEDIEAAFGDVSLGDGIGIHEAIVIDYCVSDNKRDRARKKDIRDNWSRIPEELIGTHYQALCFMDEKGLRFHLPAGGHRGQALAFVYFRGHKWKFWATLLNSFLQPSFLPTFWGIRGTPYLISPCKKNYGDSIRNSFSPLPVPLPRRGEGTQGS